MSHIIIRSRPWTATFYNPFHLDTTLVLLQKGYASCLITMPVWQDDNTRLLHYEPSLIHIPREKVKTSRAELAGTQELTGNICASAVLVRILMSTAIVCWQISWHPQAPPSVKSRSLLGLKYSRLAQAIKDTAVVNHGIFWARITSGKIRKGNDCVLSNISIVVAAK